MKKTIVDQAGDVRCPNCGARNSFTSKRTGKAKVIGVATVGVGAVAMPKRLQCQGCGSYLKPGAAKLRASAAPPLSARAKLIIGAVVAVFFVIAAVTGH